MVRAQGRASQCLRVAALLLAWLTVVSNAYSADSLRANRLQSEPVRISRLLHADTTTKLSDESSHRLLTMEDALLGLALAVVAGVSTGIGACVLYMMPREGPHATTMAYVFGLAAGIMLGVSMEMLFSKSLVGHSQGAEKGNWWWLPLLLFVGVGVTFMISQATQCIIGSGSNSADQKLSSTEGTPRDTRKLHFSYMLLFALTIQNFPEGIAVALSALSSVPLGIIICFGIVCLNIPEGAATAISIHSSTGSKVRACALTMLSGISVPLGALFATIIAILFLQTYPSPELIESLLAFVAGVLLYIAVVELLPEAMGTGCYKSAGFGVLSGILAMAGIAAITYKLQHSDLHSF